jgi:hypothetical protein
MKVMLAASNSWIDLSALWKIVVLGLICGAGLPVIFAIGLRLLSLPPGGAGATSASDGEERIYFGNVGGAIGAGCALPSCWPPSASASTGSSAARMRLYCGPTRRSPEGP